MLTLLPTSNESCRLTIKVRVAAGESEESILETHKVDVLIVHFADALDVPRVEKCRHNVLDPRPRDGTEEVQVVVPVHVRLNVTRYPLHVLLARKTKVDRWDVRDRRGRGRPLNRVKGAADY
jgi:hypothetical protein